MKKSHNSMGMGRTTDKEKIATALTITIFKSSSFVTLPQTFKRRSTITKPRLVSCTANGISALANINEFVDTAKLFSLINDFNIDKAEDFINAIGKCFPQQVEKEDKNKETKYDSKYQVIDFSEFGVKILLRVSNHDINAFNIKDDVEEAYSIVVKHKKSKKTFVNRDDITVKEYIYWVENCNRERYLNIAKSIYKFLETSEWDETIAPADYPPATKGLGEITVESELQRLSPQVVEPKFFRRQIKQCLKMGRQQTAQALQVMLDYSEKSARKFVVCLYIKDKTLNHQVSAKIEWDIKKEGYRVYLATNSRELTYNKTCPQTLEQAKRIAFDGIREHRQEINRLLNTEFIDFDINNFSFEEEYGIVFDYDRWKKTQAVNPEYKVGDRIRFYYVADEYEGIIVRKEGENFIVKVPYGDGYRLRSASYKDIISISTDSISVEEYENIYWRHYNRYKATEEYKRLYEAIRSLSAAKLALEFENKYGGEVDIVGTITDWCETNGYSYDKYFADKVLKDYAEQQARIDGYRELVDKFSTQTGNLNEKLSILAKYFKGSRNVVKVRITQNPPEIGNDPIHAYSYPTGVAYSDVRFEQYTDGNGWDYLSVAYKFNETGEVKVSCDALTEYKELIAKLKDEDTSTKFTLFQFAQHLSSQFDNGESYDWAKVQRLAKELGVNSTPQELMQACEVAIVMSARRMISQHSDWSAGQCFEQMKRLYSQQPIISTNSSDSLRWQQYSTPCPISYLAGLYVSQGTPQYGFYEPTAGNGMLTIALPVGSTVVNEIDPVRFENLKKAGYAQTFNGDAVALANSEYAQRNYNVIMNPPFGNLKQSEYLYRDGKVADNSATYTFKRLDHKIAVLSLEKFLGDNGARAAIIVGGKLAAKYNKADDEAYWNKQGRLQGAFGDFISYLNRAYLVDDIFYIDGKLYAKQGTQFPIVLILVRGRRKQWDSDPLCKWRTYDSIKDKPVQSFDELMIRMRPYLASNEHDALLERLNAKLVRLEKMKIEGNVEPTAVPEPELKHKYDIGDSFLDKDNIVCTIVDRFVSDGKIGYYLMYDKVSVKHPVIAEENWLDSMKKLPNPKFKIGQMIRYLSLGGWKNGYVRSYSWSNLFDTYTYEIICFSGGMSYEIKEYNMSEISLGYSEEKCYSISEPVCKKGDLIRDRKTKNTYTVRQVLLYNVDHKYKNQRFGVGGTVVKSSASYLYYVSEHPSPYSEKEFTVVNKGLGDADSFEKYQEFIQNALHSNSHEKIECTDLISEHSRQVVNRLLKKNIKGYYIKADDIRHTRNEHGKQSEYLRNQIPITDDDLAKIPEILSVPTNIDLPPYNMRNGQGVRFVKQFPDGKIFCVMVDLYESDELSIKTGYKKGIEGFETLMPPPLQGIDELQQAVPKHNARNARALPMLVANVTNFFRIK